MEETGKKKNWFVRHKIVTGIIVVIVVLGVIGAAGGSKTDTSTPNTSQTQEPTKAVEATKISVTELADDFDSNQVAAEKKWNGKLVEFSAVVSNITDSGLSFTNIGSKQFSLTQISCNVSDKQSLLSLKNGESVTVKGTIGKQTIGVIGMTDCEVVK